MASPHQQTKHPATGVGAAIRRVVPLAEATDEELPQMGAKAAGLARMLRAGLPVPPGFCVTGRAYRMHVSSGAVGRKLREATARLKTAPAEAVPTVLAEIRRAIREAALAAEVRRGIERQWLEIAAPAFAVRSSATAEDLPAMSFAGQYDTHLAVTGLATCLQRVKDCWASLWSRRAYEYRGRAGIDHRSVAMAVIVQAMVPAEAAGVAFTADPVSGRRDQVIVEGSYGLGKAVVDGLVTPDRVVVSRRVTVVVARTNARKTRQLVPAPGGGVREEAVEADRAGRPCLDDVTAVRLAKLAVRAEALFGAPQDVEWALAGGQIHLLQSRPITALPPKPDRPWEDRQIWTNSNLREAAPDPVTPMTWSFIYRFWEPMFAPLLRAVGLEEDPARFAGLVGGRVYFNVNAGVAIARRLGRFAQDDTRALFGDGHLTGTEAEVCLPDEDLPDIRLPWWRKLVRWPVLPLRFLWDASRVRPQLLPGSRALLRELEGRPWRAQPDARLVERLGELLGAIRRTLSDVFPVLIAGMGFYLVLVRLCGRWFGEEGLSIAHRLLAGTGGMEDAEAGVALWQLAAMAHRDAGVEEAVRGENGFAAVRQRLGGTPGGQAFLGAWSRFMATHGHHARGEIELGNPRWAEQPDYVLGQVRALLGGLDRTDPVARARRLRRQRAALAGWCRRTLRDPLRRLLFDAVLRRAQQGLRFRETSKSLAVRWIAMVRWTLGELGERLARRGVLERPDDVFLLRLEELAPVIAGGSALDVRSTVARRRQEHDGHLAVAPPPVVFGRFDPAAVAGAVLAEGTDELRGFGVSPGVARGKARVILHAEAGQVLPGEVLVAPITDPGWTPYFLNAVGIVIDQGGLLSHGSIIAREYGIPCVTNVAVATRLIRTGQTVEVDGTCGIVRVLS